MGSWKKDFCYYDPDTEEFKILIYDEKKSIQILFVMGLTIKETEELSNKILNLKNNGFSLDNIKEEINKINLERNEVMFM